MADTKIFESRLITRDSAIGVSSVTKCVSKLQQYLLSIQQREQREQREGGKGEGKQQQQGGGENDNNNNNIKLTRESYCREVLLYKIEMEKFKEAYEMCEQEIKGYSPLFYSSLSFPFLCYFYFLLYYFIYLFRL